MNTHLILEHTELHKNKKTKRDKRLNWQFSVPATSPWSGPERHLNQLCEVTSCRATSGVTCRASSSLLLLLLLCYCCCCYVIIVVVIVIIVAGVVIITVVVVVAILVILVVCQYTLEVNSLLQGVGATLQRSDSSLHNQQHAVHTWRASKWQYTIGKQ